MSWRPDWLLARDNGDACRKKHVLKHERLTTKARRANPPKRNEKYKGANKEIRGKTVNFVRRETRGASQWA